MAKNRKTPDMNLPVWFDGQNINEALFCEEFLQESRIIFANRAFFTPNGRVTDDIVLRGEVYEKLKSYTISSVPQKIKNIMELLKLEAMVEDLPPQPDRIHVANGTLMLDGRFIEGKKEIVQSRLPVSYNPNAAAPALWLNFLDGLLYEEDIPTLQEFIGYCLIPSNKGQRMMVIKGNGGEGKSQIGAVLSTIFGTNMKDGSIGKISENRFARADLEHILLCVDDDMRMEALRQTNYVKSIVTAQGKMDLERKGKQSYQGWMFARLMAFSNGDLQALYDRKGEMYMVRYADDFVFLFQYENEARKFYQLLIERLKKFGLEIAEDKSRILPFGRYKGTKESFDFLGFTHYNAKSHWGKYCVLHRTSKKKLKIKREEAKKWIWEHMHESIADTIETLNIKLAGHYR